ncbi:hypothetical protein SEA_BENCZKOWSKI14_66 [Gordonia phage Benczkowski14]|uniref:Uncharacterized protein n=5 Tax=Demosthenesvirus katyusha TaxID=1982108 RepID=A0A345MCA4_9CAUD|nr:hypothetical protein BH765_gp65 [Gordonia phage Kvothe]YP_009603340.1 hypothetical protein FDH67_gp66 [Gordonia phage Katyusha]AMS03776.1 hypothetical protein SEA_BENCZKOWSKI14_66 [Gordonia phage Benczkowski14]AXH68125.1 hypothetical protein SEA_TEATEALATTE_67 [Gordonia phage Teatealatte]QBP29623.1 hypothetical protein SEA_TREDGE_66 [Gordonia phage Tredge]UJD20702.1 hypothetical protein SEA_NIAGARA_66 [Gordonia phage Niagara]AMS03459.1 hypothetical protein SEA_KATYUSHA_66 [Gordonia phage K
MPKGGEPCLFCDEYPCSCNKPARKKASAKPKASTTSAKLRPKPKPKVEAKPAPKPARRKPVVEVDHDMDSAIRLFHTNGMLSLPEVRKHKEKLGPSKPTGKLLKYKGGDDDEQ